MATSKDLCGHGLYGTLCHKCYGEHHTYIVIFSDGKMRKFTARDSDSAISLAKKYLRGRAISAVSITCEVYRRVYPNKVPGVEEDKEPTEDEV